MKTQFLWALGLTTLMMILTSPSEASDKEDCSCPVIRCGPCQKAVQIGKKVKFCSWGDINVCKKMICENVSGYFKCLSGGGAKKQTPVSSETVPKEDMVLLYEKKVTKKRRRSKKRKLSSIRYLDKEEENRPVDYDPEGLILMEDTSRNFNGEEFSGEKFGTLVSRTKKIELQHHRKIYQPRKGETLYVGDQLTNPSKTVQTIQLKLPKGSVSIKMEPGAQINLKDPLSLMGRSEPFLHLLKGGIIAHLKTSDGRLDILAGRAMASLHQGQIFVQYQTDPSASRVHTENQGGTIFIRPAGNLSAKARPLPPGKSIQWIAGAGFEEPALTDGSVLPSAMIVEDEGLFSPIFPLPEKRQRRLGLLPKIQKPLFDEWKRKHNREIASADDGTNTSGLCHQPGGDFEMCAWNCENNPKGAKACQTQRPTTRCVRRTCNANGQWAHPTLFDSPYSDLCPSSGVRIGPCEP